MKFGINFDILQIEMLDKAKAQNVDYVEFYFRNIANANENDFEKVLEWREKNNLLFTHANVMLMPEYILLGKNATSKDDIKDILTKGFSRAKQLGCKSVVFGSGASRKIPDGMSREAAYTQLYGYFSLFCELAKPYDIEVVIEPLNHNETNVFNTVSESYDFIKDYCGKTDNLFLLADSYHMRVDNESFDTLKACRDMLHHAHIAAAEVGNKSIREFPTVADPHNIREFISALKAIDYNGDVTIEASAGKRDFFDAVTEAMTALKSW